MTVRGAGGLGIRRRNLCQPKLQNHFLIQGLGNREQAEAPAKDKETLKAGLPAGNSAWVKHTEQQLYGSCQIEFNLRGEVGA